MDTIIIEDGSGLDNSNSYASVVEFKSYHTDRDVDVSDYSTNQITIALIEATVYVDLRWHFKGMRFKDTQALKFPRKNLFDRYQKHVEPFPWEIKKATILYALNWLKKELYPTPPSGTSKDLKKKKTVVGPITTEVEYQGAATASSYLSFPLADNLCKLYTNAAGGTMRN